MACTCEKVGERTFRGVTTAIARYSCDSGEDTAQLLAGLASDDSGGDLVAAAAARILALANGDPAQLGPAVQRFVQLGIAYVDESRETFQSAEVTLRRREGDCDDHARLVLVLGRAVGLAGRLVIMRRGAIPVHAVSQLADADGVLQWAETTIEAAWGEHPVAAKARLGLSQRSDLG